MTFIRNALYCLVLLLVNYPVQAKQLNLLFQQIQDKIALGYLHEAETQLQDAKPLVGQNPYTATAITGLQGYLALEQKNYRQAEPLLINALGQAQKKAWPDLISRFALYLGQLNNQQQQPSQAQHYFELSLAQAQQVTDHSLTVSSLSGLAKLAMRNQKFDLAWQYLQQSKAALQTLPINPVSTQLRLNIGYQTLQLAQQNPTQPQYLQSSFDSLQQALTQARQLNSQRIQASSLKYLAALYQQQQQSEQAIKLLLEAISIAQQEPANDILLDLQWQLAEIYKTKHQPLLAISAYRQALKQLEVIRLDIPVSYQKGLSSFKTTFAPLYLGLADLLLQQAPLAKSEQQQTLLHEAQDTIELMKKSEMEDYFQSRCELAATPIDLKKTDPHAAAIYPISLPNRLEIIVVTAQGLHQFTQAITAQTLTQQARAFSSQLRDPFSEIKESKKQAQTLYHWLILPIKTLLATQHIETLIYIPDGALRLVPLAALYDGQKFLIEDYAVVTSAAMSLIESSSIAHENQAILLAGMSTPGDVISDLPESILSGLVDTLPVKGSDNRQLSRALKLRSGGEQNQTTEINAEKTPELHELLKNQTVVKELKEELALPGVETEIKQLAEQNGMPYFLNEDFSLAHFTELADSQPHKILHIASHGIFGATAEESFIMTYDKILNMNKLEVLLSSDYFKQHPIDLITLSACQTAEGDDRSPLGISGIAIKSKVHSAMGSLWSVADEATAQLMSIFYQELKKSGVGKAKALQQAEIQLLKQKAFSNPSFWSPFILVGDWL